MTMSGRFRSWGRRFGIEVLGWFLVVAGVAALVLPGPGLLMLFAGLAVLSQEYEWAERRLEPIKRRAFEAAHVGVRTWPRIIASVLGGLWLIAIGIVWIRKPTIPEFWIFGPELPFGGWGTGLSLVLSGFIAFALLIYSYRRFHGVESPSARTSEADGIGRQRSPYDDVA